MNQAGVAADLKLSNSRYTEELVFVVDVAKVVGVGDVVAVVPFFPIQSFQKGLPAELQANEIDRVSIKFKFTKRNSLYYYFCSSMSYHIFVSSINNSIAGIKKRINTAL